MPVTMRDIYYERPGSAGDVLKLAESPVPVPDSGEALVQVHASDVNPSDVKTHAAERSGGALPFKC